MILTLTAVAAYLAIGMGVAVVAVRWFWNEISEWPRFPSTGPRYVPNSKLGSLIVFWPIEVGAAFLTAVCLVVRWLVLRAGGRR